MTANKRVAAAQRQSIVFGLVALAVLALEASASAATGFAVRDVTLRSASGVYLLDANIDFAFSKAVIEALENGVTLTVVLETDVLRRRRWMWNESIANAEARYSIEFHALSAQYLLRNVELGISQSYRRLDALTDDLGRLRDFPLIGERRVRDGEQYRVRLRARLDIESLPAPMRPLAYLSSLWRLDSDWSEWPLP